MSLSPLEYSPRARFALAATVLGILAAAQFALGWHETMWLDELTSYWFSHTDSLADVLARMIGRRDPHPPLYQALLHLWLQLPGASESVLGARLSSIALSVAAGLTSTFLAERLTSEGSASSAGRGTAALVFACLFAGSAVNLHYGVELRSYQLQMTFASMLLACRDHARFDTHGRLASAAALGWVVSAWGLSLTHYYGALFVGCTLLVDLLDVALGRANRRTAKLSAATLAGPLAAAAWLGYQATHGGLGRKLHPPSLLTLTYFHKLLGPVEHFVLLAFALGLVWLSWRHARRGPPLPAFTRPELLTAASRTGASAVLLAITFAVLVSLQRPILQSSNFSVFVPSVLLLSTVLAAAAARRVAFFGRCLPLALGLILLGSAAQVRGELQTKARNGEDYWLFAREARGPLVMTTPDMANKVRDASQLASWGRDRIATPRILVAKDARSPADQARPESLPHRFTLACPHCAKEPRRSLEALARESGAQCERMPTAPRDWGAHCKRRAR